MAENLTQEQTTTVREFVEGLEGVMRDAAKDYVLIPNNSNCQPKVAALIHAYGDDFHKIANLIGHLRKKLGVHYDVLQPALKQQLYQ